jgi:endonuclease YncB( thermonuclease family)
MSPLRLRPILLVVALSVGSLATAATLSGTVVGVSDGDTITVLDEANVPHKVRLEGIDAPEAAQAFGQRSKQSLSELVYRKTVRIETHKRDRYGRTVGKVSHGEVDVNLEQLRRGLAWHYKAYAHEQTLEDRVKYKDAEDTARTSRLGLWSDASPIPPWEWRKQKR